MAICLACALLFAQVASSAAPPVPDAPIVGNRTGFLSECGQLAEEPRVRCYVKGLLDAVERSGDPAHALPAIDAKVHEVGGFLEAACHSFMHEVGRTWAKAHEITLENLYSFIPRSNDPGCSAGFGMGLTMYLGPELVLEPRRVLRTCSSLPTRFREYTCIHGSGHALMRGYHGALRASVDACNTLGKVAAPDCAQGAFHDYWIALGGGDGTTAPEGADTSPESVCGAYTYKRPCWYRYFWEREDATRVYTVDDILGLCGHLEHLDRAGCIGAASLLVSRERDPVDHARVCAGLDLADTYDCLRGVNVPALAGKQFEQLRLLDTCGALPRATQNGCYFWFGKTLAVLTDGAFRRTGCAHLSGSRAKLACTVGGARMGRPLRTFS